METVILAGGCFWCTEAVFQRVKGVEEVQSGFSGGHIKNPPYREVIQGRTGHAESIKVVYNPDIISFKEILMVFMATHNPTTLNRQGADVGTHYRSAIFYTTNEQHENNDYYNNNRMQGYCQFVIDPKVRKLMNQYGNLTK